VGLNEIKAGSWLATDPCVKLELAQRSLTSTTPKSTVYTTASPTTSVKTTVTTTATMLPTVVKSSTATTPLPSRASSRQLAYEWDSIYGRDLPTNLGFRPVSVSENVISSMISSFIFPNLFVF